MSYNIIFPRNYLCCYWPCPEKGKRVNEEGSWRNPTLLALWIPSNQLFWTTLEMWPDIKHLVMANLSRQLDEIWNHLSDGPRGMSEEEYLVRRATPCGAAFPELGSWTTWEAEWELSASMYYNFLSDFGHNVTRCLKFPQARLEHHGRLYPQTLRQNKFYHP